MLVPRPHMTSLPCLITKRAAIESREWIPAASMASTSPKSMMIFESPSRMRSWMGFSNSSMSGVSIRPLGRKTRMTPSRLCVASIVKSGSATSGRQFDEIVISMNETLLTNLILYAKKLTIRAKTTRMEAPRGRTRPISRSMFASFFQLWSPSSKISVPMRAAC